jgi:hypothetical protein
MRPVFAGAGASVGTGLPELGTGQSFLMGQSGAREVRTDPALLRTEQLGAEEILAFAAALRRS